MNIYNIFAPIYHHQRSNFYSLECNRPVINWLILNNSQSVTYMKLYHKIFVLPSIVLLHIIRFVACKRIVIKANSILKFLKDKINGFLDRNLFILNVTSGKNKQQRHPPNKPHPLMFEIQNYFKIFLFQKITLINSKLS